MSRLCELLQERVDPTVAGTRPGCPEEAISRVEREIGIPFPEEYRVLLRRANGQYDDARLSFPPDQLRMLSVEDVLSEWSVFNDMAESESEADLDDDDRVVAVLYHPKRVPIAAYESGSAYLCLDYLPGPAGHEGQLVFNQNEIDVVVLEASIPFLLQRYIDALQSGAMALARMPPDRGEGWWFTANGRYVNLDVYREAMDHSLTD